MTQQSRISEEIPAQTLADCASLLQQVATALQPYLQTLTKAERKKLAKLGDKTVGFMEKTITYTGTHPEFIPAYLDVPEMKRDYTLQTGLRPVWNLLDTLGTQVNDTMLLAGSEAYNAGRLYYNSSRDAAKQGIPNARTVYDDLAARFPGRRKKPTGSGGGHE